MPIAKYTQELMDQLHDTGVCLVGLTDSVTEAVARSRIVNAASRSNRRVRTVKVEVDGMTFILGEATDDHDLIAHGQLRQRGYRVQKLLDGRVMLAFVISDKPRMVKSNILGEWPSADEALHELSISGWPTTPEMLATVRRLRKEPTSGPRQSND